MTRYQAAVSTLSTMLAKARAPNQMDSVTRDPRTLTLPPQWKRADRSIERPPLLVRLWRAIGGGRRFGNDSRD
jgi:hypothetical protein